MGIKAIVNVDKVLVFTSSPPLPHKVEMPFMREDQF